MKRCLGFLFGYCNRTVSKDQLQSGTEDCSERTLTEYLVCNGPTLRLYVRLREIKTLCYGEIKLSTVWPISDFYDGIRYGCQRLYVWIVVVFEVQSEI